MKIKLLIPLTALALAMLFTAPAFSAEDPSMHQVYLAAEAGKFSEAQSMMDKVLKDHPNSAKAHFVESELLAKQGRYTGAQDELNIAERLQPGLSFAKPQVIAKLKAQIASTHAVNPLASNQNLYPGNSGGTPWGMILLMFALISFIYFAAKWMTKRNPAVTPTNYSPSNTNQYPQQYTNQAPLAGQAGGGLGSSIMGGLATGAALGAGMVAGEALMHHFTDGEHSSNDFINTAQANDKPENLNDMGGADFGIADSSSWDDSSGSDDWA